MQYANDGSLVSYLDQNINKLTWKMKLQLLSGVAHDLHQMHDLGLIHCDLHGGNIVLNNISNQKERFYLSNPFICDLGLSKSVDSTEVTTNIRGVLPFIAPEVFNTCKFTQKSDIYAFGIIMYLTATGEPPFRDRQFDRNLVCAIFCVD